MSNARARMLVLLLAGCGLFPALSFAQGAITPTGTPAPTMKTLSQIEPRTPVDATHTPGTATTNYKISSPGSYYLTGNISGGSGKTTIEIASSNVTLDLMGFRLQGYVPLVLLKPGAAPPPSSPSRAGVLVSLAGATNISIVNGSLRGYKQNGIDAGNATNVVLQNLMVSDCDPTGINTGSGATVSQCVVESSSQDGIVLGKGSTATGCTARANGYNGINVSQYGGVLTDCTSIANTRSGFTCAQGTTIANCTASSNTQHGFAVQSNATIVGCTATYNKGYGFGIPNSRISDSLANNNQLSGISGGNALINDCIANYNTKWGIYANRSTVRGCVAAGNEDGIYADASIVQDCTADSNIEDGIQVGSNCQILKNNCTANGNHGLVLGLTAAGVGGNRIEGNTLNQNHYGMLATSFNTKNLIIGNSSGQNKATSNANYHLSNSSNNFCGTIITSINAINTNVNSFANFSY